MKRQYALVLPVALCFLLGLTGKLHASVEDTVRGLEQSIKEYNTDIENSKKELKSLLSKIEKSNKKLASIEDDLVSKQARLEKTKASIGLNPSSEQIEFLENEAERISLAGLTIKSRKAAIARLERKSDDLRARISDAGILVGSTQEEIVAVRKRAEAAEKAAAQARAYKLRRELEELKRENEQLRIAMEEEARRTREANKEAARLAELARQKEEQQKSTAVTAAPATAKATAAVGASKSPKRVVKPAAHKTPQNPSIDPNVDPTQIVLPGEPPIDQRRDRKKVVIRSRNIKKDIRMDHVGNKIYRAEVQLPSGKAYFDVRARRYRGYFPKTENVNGIGNYVFFYDLRNRRRPIFSVARAGEEELHFAKISGNYAAAK